jgi:hypothetical protein
MKQTALLALVVLVAAGSMVSVLLVVSRDAREVARGLDKLTGEVKAIAEDVNSVADDVNAIANVLAGEPDTGEAAFHPALFTRATRSLVSPRRIRVAARSRRQTASARRGGL